MWSEEGTRAKRGTRGGSLLHVGGDVAGADGVDLDVVLAPLVAEGLCELSECAFRRRVRGHGEAPLEREERAEIDDLPAAKGHHVATCRLAEQPRRLEVDVQHLHPHHRQSPATHTHHTRHDTHVVPVLLWKIDAGGTTLDAGAVDEDVDMPVHFLEGTVEYELDGVEVGEVARHVLAAGDDAFDGGGVVVAGDEAEACTGLGEGDCAGQSDATGCACDEDVGVPEGEELRRWDVWCSVGSHSVGKSEGREGRRVRGEGAE